MYYQLNGFTLIAATLQHLDFIKFIDERLEQKKANKTGMSYGQLLFLLMLQMSSYGRAQGLYDIHDFWIHHPYQAWLQNDSAVVDQNTHIAMTDALEAITRYGYDKLFSEFVAKMCEHNMLSEQAICFNSTTQVWRGRALYQFDPECEDDYDPEYKSDLKYSYKYTFDAPYISTLIFEHGEDDYKEILAQITMLGGVGSSGLPLFFKRLDDYITSDQETFPNLFKTVAPLLRDVFRSLRWIVTDHAGCL